MGYPDDPNVKPPKLHKAKPKLAAEFDGPIRDIPFTPMVDPRQLCAQDRILPRLSGG